MVVNALPPVNAGADQDVCAGTSVTLSGAGASSYVWTNGVSNGVSFVPALGTVSYTVTGTDANGCQNTDQVNVRYMVEYVDAAMEFYTKYFGFTLQSNASLHLLT